MDKPNSGPHGSSIMRAVVAMKKKAENASVLYMSTEALLLLNEEIGKELCYGEHIAGLLIEKDSNSIHGAFSIKVQ